MKRKLLWALAALIAAGLVFTGCPTEDNGSEDVVYLAPSTAAYGSNLVTEAAILAATGYGGTSVTKTDKGYEVTGTVTDYSNWDGSVKDKRIMLEIQASSANPDAYFAKANRYVITVDFPNSSVKPIPDYTDGFRIYLENNKATPNTTVWAGTWQHEWPDEYNAIGGAGKMTINRDLSVDGDGDPLGSEIGDYQHLVLVLVFEDADEGKEYKYTISNVGIYGEKIDDSYPGEVPIIHETSELDDATYPQNAAAKPLVVVASWTANSENYTYQWYSNSTKSNTGGTAIAGRTTTSFAPPTDAEGTIYYYVVVTFEGRSATSSVVTIIVTDEISLPSAYKVTGLRSYLQETTNWGGTWANQYNDDPFNGNFTGTAAVSYNSGTLAAPGVYNQFVLDLYFTAGSVGKNYEFTISNVKALNAGGSNTMTEADILSGFRAGNDLNGWAQQANVVTKVSDGVYKAKMAIIANVTDGADNGLARLIFNRSSTDSVASYTFDASLPSVFAE